MTDPVLDHWRLLTRMPDCLGFFVGIVTGHPLLRDGWITTSVVMELGEDRSWARTMSRRYRLAAELPHDLPLPAEAANLLLTRFLSAVPENADLPLIEKLTKIAESFSEAPQQNEDAVSMAP
jgi:hypothetical protein